MNQIKLNDDYSNNRDRNYNLNNIILEVENLSIMFKMHHERVDSLKEYVFKFLKSELKSIDFLALNNITFKINKGESLGIIGKNGSGKSTLLKTISGIFEPSLGSVVVKGSISPMIELGSGFDHELTARENIYLNGMLLGMTKKEVKSHFNEIVEFAELEEFLDVPLKNFSSGMLARLGFSIATVKKPDILIVDEVLSVGDFKFQRKCFDRIEQLLEGDTTLFFVSHSVHDVKRLCDKAIWIENGKLKMYGNTEDVCAEYEKS